MTFLILFDLKLMDRFTLYSETLTSDHSSVCSGGTWETPLSQRERETADEAQKLKTKQKQWGASGVPGGSDSILGRVNSTEALNPSWAVSPSVLHFFSVWGCLIRVCTCWFECTRLDFQIPALLYGALALESLVHSFSNFLQCTKWKDRW